MEYVASESSLPVSPQVPLPTEAGQGGATPAKEHTQASPAAEEKVDLKGVTFIRPANQGGVATQAEESMDTAEESPKTSPRPDTPVPAAGGSQTSVTSAPVTIDSSSGTEEDQPK